ncbi:MAG: hypothetical protein ACREJ3_19980 [Polyangiaceae bacterium]
MGRPRKSSSGAVVAVRRVAWAIAGFLLSFVMLSGIAHANARYFYCEAMGVMSTNPCSAGDRSATGKGVGAEVRQQSADCCHLGIFAPMPEATPPPVRSIPPAALVAVMPLRAWIGGPQTSAYVEGDHAVDRWRIPSRSAAKQRALGMVLRT